MRFLAFAALFSLIVLCAAGLRAADIVWSGASSGNWTNTANWVGGALPGAGDVAVFDGSGSNYGAITNVSGTIQGIRVSANIPISVSLALSGPLTLDGGTYAIYLLGSNSLSVTGTAANNLVIGAEVNINDGDLTATDTQFGLGTAGQWILVSQRHGNVNLGATTVVETTGSGANDSVSVEFERTTGGTGTVTLASLTVEGDTTNDVASQDEENAARAQFENCTVTVTGTITLDDGATVGGNNNNGARLEVRDSSIALGANLVIGNGASTVAASGAEANLEDSSLTLAAGSTLSVNARGSLMAVNCTITAGGAAAVNSVATAADVIFLDSTLTATTPGDLTLDIGGAGGFLGVAFIRCNLSNYSAAGLSLKPGTYLVALNECNFTGGQAAGSHITVNGLTTPTNPFPADLNQFDLSTGVTTTSWVNVLSATSLAFRVATGQDFGFGATTVNAVTAETYDNDAAGLGTNIGWGDTFNLMTAATGGTQPTGLRADTTADQPLFFFDLTATTGNSTVTSVSINLELEDHTGGFGLSDIAAVTLFNDANSNEALDTGETLATVASPASNTVAFAISRALSQATSESWGIALTFAAGVAGKSGTAGMFMLPTVGIVADNGTVAGTTIVGGLPLILFDSLPVSGAPATLALWDQPGDAYAGTAFGRQPRAVVVDGNGQRVGYVNAGTVTPSIQNDPVGGSSLIGSDAAGVSVAEGYAQFTNLGIDQAGSPFVVRFTATGITFSGTGIVDSANFEVLGPPAEIDVQRTGTTTSIPDGTGTDNINSHSTLAPFTVDYDILNTGGSALHIGAVTFPSSSNCTPSLQTAPGGTVGAASSTQFTVSVTLASGSGAFSFQVEIANSDSDEHPYTFTVSGLRIEPDAEIRFNSVAVANGGSHAVTGAVAGTALNVQYTIVNTGDEDLTLTGASPVTVTVGTVSGNCTIGAITQPTPLVVPANGGTANFSVLVTPIAAGAFDFDVSLASNDPDEDPYDITGNGTAAAAPEPEIGVERGGTAIADGGSDTLSNLLIGTAAPFTYDILNTGSANLTFTGGTPVTIANQVGCTVTVTAQPVGPVAPSGQTTFTISVNASAASFSFEIDIASNDSDEANYDIAVSGTAAATAPEIDVQRPAGTSIADGGTDALGNRTQSTAFVLTYTVENTGSALLTLGATAVSVSGATNCTASVTLQPATTVAAAGTATFEVTVTPNAGAFSFNLTINNDDANESPYNVLVSGTGVAPATGGGDDDDEGGCSTGGTGNWLMLALLGALLSAVALRRKRA
ncbi:MAG: hypothetical protein ICCCNLDF_00265 [Planctomycetes bacterium]|nr:hypothetical protein [Planctomycetota bacterium]